MNIENTKQFVHKVAEDLEIYLLNLCDKEEKGQKKSELITYWLRDYISYLKFEEKFTPKKMKGYSRGDIIKVNFGFNLGNEEGGLHYAVVIDNENSQASGVVTVIPLSSLKKNETISKYDVCLGSELYNLMKHKYNLHNLMYEKSIENARIESVKCKKELDRMDDELNLIKNDNPDKIKEKLKKWNEDSIRLNNKIEEFQNTCKECKRKLDYIKKIKKEFDRMNEGSKALVGQITTVSKMRIFDPKQDSDILAGIRLSPKQLDDITKKN